ncbi:metal-dependent hydrolase [Apiospora aurea]|uniref:Metal-dependent hydrolase n=1 Tax=Apiospora aurea TaxID=335848 RepID=A0ABR1QNM5_9PEZI
MGPSPALAVLHNGRFFTSQGTNGRAHAFTECLVIDATGTIAHVGSLTDPEVARAEAAGAVRHDMQGRVVLPGFVEGHMHLLRLGQSLQNVALDECKNLKEVRDTIRRYARENPEVPRICCKGWMYAMLTEGEGEEEASTGLLDDLDPRPIYIDEKSLHSTWCNTAAVKEMGLQEMPDPQGGKIHRDTSGNPTGVLAESAVMLVVWPHLAKVASMEEKLSALQGAIASYTREGYTGAVDMAFDENMLEAVRVLRKLQQGKLPIRLAAHWLITPRASAAENLAQVDRAVELWNEFKGESDFRIAGIKIICDGIVDACTAALTEPYASTGTNSELLWTVEDIVPVVRKADQAGLQCALHAIGDRAVRAAIDALEQAATPDAGKRHRIEHLEMTSPEDAARLGKLGITASVQPVHADPAILKAWPRLLGEERCGRAFAYKEFVEGGAVLALGCDAPTAPHGALKNIYTAATRRSARDPAVTEEDGDEDAVGMMNPQFALELAAAVAAATAGSAYSCFMDRWAGRLEKGLSADLAVVEMEWEAEKLLEARVRETWFRGLRFTRRRHRHGRLRTGYLSHAHT